MRSALPLLGDVDDAPYRIGVARVLLHDLLRRRRVHSHRTVHGRHEEDGHGHRGAGQPGTRGAAAQLPNCPGPTTHDCDLYAFLWKTRPYTVNILFP